MSRQDQVIDDDEPESCPLCIEELDLSDRGFRPCPCGYQVCQFCYNNIKTTMNGLCPACRRPYEATNIRFEAPSQEEVVKFRENKAHQDKKKAAAKRQEAASRQADTLSRKHLAGIRVRRQNLVYVTGLRLNTSDPQLSEKLRGEQFFGQYGKIDKVVVNKPKDSRALQPVGVYITYFDKEAAALCISVVNGSDNSGGTVKADYGTTKYCSAFLRHETCSNKNCTFLHEVGEDNESFTREGLSSLNASSAQQAQQSSPTDAPTPPQPQPPLLTQSIVQTQHQPPVPHIPDDGEVRDVSTSAIDSPDNSALPSTVSWANRNTTSRRPSQSQSYSSASPTAVDDIPDAPVALEDTTGPKPLAEVQEGYADEIPLPLPRPGQQARPHVDPIILQFKKALATEELRFEFDHSYLSEKDRALMENMPLLFDPNGGAKRYQARQREAERRRLETDAQVASQALSAMNVEDMTASGSLQLGGEPEDRHDMEGNRQNLAIQPPTSNLMSPSFSVAHTLSPEPQRSRLNGRALAPQQSQVPMQAFKSPSPGLLGHNPNNQGQGSHHASGHARQSSRFNFSNESTSGTSSARPSSRAKFSNQQPPTSSHYSQGSSGGQLFSSGIQGPPPGLKATGTPPVSGGGMFGQGHGFATAGLAYGASSGSRNSNEEMLRELMRNRGGSAGSGQTSEGGRREFMFSSPVHPSQTSSSHTLGLSSFPYGPHSGAFQDNSPQKQKKKGKKHRHANTSSSGGGVVDLADPSILQSRMHQTGGAGQSHYGAQGQGQDQLPSSFGHEDPFISTSDETFAAFSGGLFGNIRRSTPSMPPGLAKPGQGWPSRTVQIFQLEPRPFQIDTPPMTGLGAEPRSLRVRQSRIEQLVGMEVEKSLPAATAQSSKPPLFEPDVRHPAVETNPRPSTASTTLDEASFPSLPRPSLKSASSLEKKADTLASSVSSAKSQRAKKADETLFRPWVENEASTEPAIPKEAEGMKPALEKEGRPRPGKLDIAAATEATMKNLPTDEEEPAKQSTPVRAIRERSLTSSTASRPGTPVLSSDTSAKRATDPRTLRHTPTPKAETPPLASSMSSASATQHSTAKASPSTSRQTSRRPSLGSMSVAETATSERMADDASVATGPTSRASSPQLFSRVGSAAVRSKTKSQTKKERQERAKTISEEQSVAGSASSEPSEGVKQEAVTGRKKKAKAKKPPTVPTTVSNTPDVSRPHSPDLSATPQEVQVPLAVQEVSEKQEPQRDVTPPAREVEEKEPEPKPQVQPPPQRDVLNPAVIVSELQALEPADLARITDLFLKSTIQTGTKNEHLTADDIWSMATPKTLTSAEVAALNRGEPVRREGLGGKASSRLMISPSRKCLPRLTKELEDRYLELEKRIMASKPPEKYTHHRKHETQILATIDDMLRDMTAILTRPPKPSTAPPKQTVTASNSSASSARRASSTSTDNTKPTIQPPASPSYASDALAFLNQFILPPLPSNPRAAISSTGKYSTSANTTAHSTPLASPIVRDEQAPAIAPTGQALSNTYTTGDPTYTVNAMDVNTLAQSAAQAAAAALGSLNPADFGIDLAALTQLTQSGAIVSEGENADLGMGITQASLNAAMKDLGALSAGSPRGTGPLPLANVSTESIRQALANAVSGVVQAAAAMAGLPHNAPGAGHGAGAGAGAVTGAGGFQAQSAASAAAAASVGNAAQQALRGMGLTPKAITVEGAEQALLTARKETEALEKRMAGLVRRNRKTAGLV